MSGPVELGKLRLGSTDTSVHGTKDGRICSTYFMGFHSTRKVDWKWGFGDVYKGTWLGTPVAIKQLHLKKLSKDLEESFLQEAKILAKCNFPNVVRLFAVCLDPGKYAMIMEFLSRGSLYDVLHNQDESISWKTRMQISIDIGNGLAYLHSNQIIHRDLKSLNVLLDDAFHAKITDFGLAKIKLETTASTMTTDGAGTTRWRAPELFSRKGSPNASSDVYSYGMVLWEIASRKLPFADAPDEVTAGIWIKDGETESIPEDWPPQYGQIIKDCWKESSQRPSAAEVVKSLTSAQSEIELATVKSWHFNPAVLKSPEATQNNSQNSTFCLLPASPADIQKVLFHYHHHPVPKLDIKSVQIIHNPALSRAFELRLGLLQQRDGKAAFAPKWATKENAEQRQQIMETMEKMAAPYKDPDYPAVKILPLWHGTRPEVLPVLFETGYANLASTDSGFFGKGIYSAHEAEYAHRVYSKGSLVLNWVSTFSAFPTVDGDMGKLQSKGNFENYDSHFVPVVPPDGKHSFSTSIYHPCKPGQTHQYIELVVFDSQQCLPRYLIELQPTLVASPTTSRRIRPRSTAFYETRRNQDEPDNRTLSNSNSSSSTSNSTSSSNNNNSLVPASSSNATTPPGEEDYMKGFQFFQLGKFREALPFMEKAAQANYPPAFLRLTRMHALDGLVGPKDEPRSKWYADQAALHFKWFMDRAHTTKNPDAILDAGFCFYYGIGIQQDYNTAVAWIQKAAEGGSLMGQYQFGCCYSEGQGVMPNMKEAMRWFSVAAERGNGVAQLNLGFQYKNNVKDYKNAMMWFQKAAENGLAAAYFNIGSLYFNGFGVPRDIPHAVTWMTKAAEMGVLFAQTTIAALYENGSGIPKDIQMAAYWYKQAMSQGHAQAAANYQRLKALNPWITV